MTNWSMLSYITNGIDAADGAGTWINALVIDAGQGFTTVGVNIALWLAARLGVTKVTWQTGADSSIVE